MNARDVIARAVAIARGDDPHYAPSQARLAREDRDTAELGLRRVVAAGYRILGPDEVDALQRALAKAEDGAGTLPAREAVKLRPADWHSLCSLVRALGRKA